MIRVDSAGTEPTREDLDAVAVFVERFDEDDFEAGAWSPSETSEDGVMTLPHWVASETVLEWHDALYKHNVILMFEWMTEEWRECMRGFDSDPSGLETADLETVRKVLTAISRSDRFCEGSMNECFKSGLAQAATQRLAAFAEDNV